MKRSVCLGERVRAPRTPPGSAWRARRTGELARACGRRSSPAVPAYIPGARTGSSGPVDLVDQHNVREHRPRPETRASSFRSYTLVPTTSAGNRVDRALDAGVLRVERAGQRPGQGGLAPPGVVLDQHVTVGDERDDHVAQDAIRRLDRARDVRLEPRAERGNGRGSSSGAVAIPTMLRSAARRRSGSRAALRGVCRDRR